LPLPPPRQGGSIRADGGGRWSPSHAEGGRMFMLPPKPDLADPYGRAPPDATHGARPNRLDRLRPALPSPHPTRRTEHTWSSADRNGTGSPRRPDAAAEKARTQAPRAKELRIMCPEPHDAPAMEGRGHDCFKCTPNSASGNSLAKGSLVCRMIGGGFSAQGLLARETGAIHGNR
jgi:hypothetical protein